MIDWTLSSWANAFIKCGKLISAPWFIVFSHNNAKNRQWFINDKTQTPWTQVWEASPGPSNSTYYVISHVCRSVENGNHTCCNKVRFEWFMDTYSPTLVKKYCHPPLEVKPNPIGAPKHIFQPFGNVIKKTHRTHGKYKKIDKVIFT